MTDKNQNQNCGVIFRESFRGYNKEDVNRYIAQVHNQFSQDSERMRQEIQRLQGKLNDAEALKTALNEEKSKTDALNQKLIGCNEIAAEAQKQKIEMSETLAQVKHELVVQTSENASLKDENAILTGKLAEAEKSVKAPEPSENEENARRYEAMSHQIGDIILSAKAEAEEITAEAKVKAAAMLNIAEQQARKTELAGIERARQLLHDSAALIKLQNEKYATDCGILVQEMSEKIAEIQGRLKTCGDDLINKNQSTLNDLQNKIPADHRD